LFEDVITTTISDERPIEVDPLFVEACEPGTFKVTVCWSKGIGLGHSSCDLSRPKGSHVLRGRNCQPIHAYKEAHMKIILACLLLTLLGCSGSGSSQLSDEAFVSPPTDLLPAPAYVDGIDAECKRRITEHKDHVLYLYEFVVTHVDDFRRYVWEKDKEYLFDPSENRYAVVLCGQEYASMKAGKECLACCCWADETIYISGISDSLITHEMCHMFWPDQTEAMANMFMGYMLSKIK